MTSPSWMPLPAAPGAPALRPLPLPLPARAISAAAAGATTVVYTLPTGCATSPAINHIPGTDRNNGQYGDVHRHPRITMSDTTGGGVWTMRLRPPAAALQPSILSAACLWATAPGTAAVSYVSAYGCAASGDSDGQQQPRSRSGHCHAVQRQLHLPGRPHRGRLLEQCRHGCSHGRYRRHGAGCLRRHGSHQLYPGYRMCRHRYTNGRCHTLAHRQFRHLRGPYDYFGRCPLRRRMRSNSNTFVATVTASGIVHGVLAGTTTIQLSTTGGCSATKAITVNNSPGIISGTLHCMCQGHYRPHRPYRRRHLLGQQRCCYGHGGQQQRHCWRYYTRYGHDHLLAGRRLQDVSAVMTVNALATGHHRHSHGMCGVHDGAD